MYTSIRSALVAGSAVLLALPALTPAQAARGGERGWGSGGAYARLYDPSKAEKIDGQVTEVRKVTPIRGMSEGLAIIVKTSTDTVTVHLGPAWFLDHQDLHVAKGDTVQVEGSRVTLRGKPVLLAASVRRGDDTLQLRDAAGVPAWAGWRRRR